jgi:hypothetical protein
VSIFGSRVLDRQAEFRRNWTAYALGGSTPLLLMLVLANTLGATAVDWFYASAYVSLTLGIVAGMIGRRFKRNTVIWLSTFLLCWTLTVFVLFKVNQ